LGATFGELELWRRNVGGLESPLGLPGRDVAEKRPDGSRRELRRERQLLLPEREENILLRRDADQFCCGATQINSVAARRRSPPPQAERKKKLAGCEAELAVL
jgi:hypothetical protein